MDDMKLAAVHAKCLLNSVDIVAGYHRIVHIPVSSKTPCCLVALEMFLTQDN